MDYFPLFTTTIQQSCLHFQAYINFGDSQTHSLKKVTFLVLYSNRLIVAQQKKSIIFLQYDIGIEREAGRDNANGGNTMYEWHGMLSQGSWQIHELFNW